MDEDSDKKHDNAEEAVEKVLICVLYIPYCWRGMLTTIHLLY